MSESGRAKVASNRENGNPLLEHSFLLAVAVSKYCDTLISQKRFALADQFFRSGTSVGANVREAQQAESRADFIHKLKLASKEVNETIYWIELCKATHPEPALDAIFTQAETVAKLLNRIISTTVNNQKAEAMKRR